MRRFLAALIAGLMVFIAFTPSSAAGFSTVIAYDNVIGGFQSEDVWDLTACELTINFTLDLSAKNARYAVNQSYAGVTGGASGWLTAAQLQKAAGGVEVFDVELSFTRFSHRQGLLQASVNGVEVDGYEEPGHPFFGEALSSVRVMAVAGSSRVKYRDLSAEGCLTTVYIVPDVLIDSAECQNETFFGVIPVVIYGSRDFEVSQINPETLLLNNVPIRRDGRHLRSHSIYQAYATYQNDDEFPDLLVYFEAKEEVVNPDPGLAFVTAQLRDYTLIEGFDDMCVSSE